MTESDTFARGLSEPFMTWLSTPLGHELLELLRAHGLDVRLRADSFNAYLAQGSLARVKWTHRPKVARLSLARAYAEETSLLMHAVGRSVSFDVTPESLRAYAAVLPRLCEVATARAGNEGRVEEGVVRTNMEGTPLLVLDRQVAVPSAQGRLDILAVMPGEGAARLVAVELKVGLDNRIQKVARQAHGYLRMLSSEVGGLREDVAVSYQQVCRQLLDLGFKAPSPELIQPEMSMEALVVLVDYNFKSKLLPRAAAQEQTLDRPVHFALLERQSEWVLPPRSAWFRGGIPAR